MLRQWASPAENVLPRGVLVSTYTTPSCCSPSLSDSLPLLHSGFAGRPARCSWSSASRYLLRLACSIRVMVTEWSCLNDRAFLSTVSACSSAACISAYRCEPLRYRSQTMSALNSSSFATVFQKPRQCLNSFRSLSTSRATFSILLWFVACHASTFTRGTPSRRTRALSASSFALSSHVSSNVVAFLRAPTKSLPMFVLATLRSLISCFALSRCPRALGKAVIGTLGFPRSAEPSGPTDRGAQIPICTAGARFAAPCITTEIRKFFPRLDLCNTAKFLRNIPEYFGIFRKNRENTKQTRDTDQ